MTHEHADILERVRGAVLADDYLMSNHAKQEMLADRLTVPDVESAVLTGTIQQEYTQDPRGPRYEIVGYACDLLTRVGVVVRLEENVLVITVYERKS